jgi:hypothetical protein
MDGKKLKAEETKGESGAKCMTEMNISVARHFEGQLQRDQDNWYEDSWYWRSN